MDKSMLDLTRNGRVPNIPHLPPSPQRPEDWFAWRDLVLVHRFQVLAETSAKGREGEEARRREMARCRESRPYMIATYGGIYEARPDEDLDESDLPPGTMIPFIPFPFQIRVMYWYYERRRTKGVLGDGLVVKSRDMGLSNIFGFLVAGDWACEPVFQARMLSRVEDLVDAAGDPDSLFWKIEMFLMGLPNWLLQGLVPGFDWKKHRMVMKFINPHTRNVISGESTQANAGRGGRATVIIYDEGAFMPNFGAIWTAGRASSRHRIGISTVSLQEGYDWHNLHHGKEGYTQPSIFVAHWDEHPMHDEAWLAGERERDTEEGIQREIFMNYQAGTSEWVYPESHTKELGDYKFIPGAGHVYCMMDDGLDDDFALVWAQYQRRTGRFHIFRTYRNSNMITDFYGTLLTGVPRSDFKYTKEDVAIMEMQRSLPPMTYTIDAHFKERSQLTGTSPYERFASEFGIVPYTTFHDRDFKARRLAMGTLLPMMDFDDAAAEALESIQRTRWKPEKEGREQVSVQKRPLHDKHSHITSAMEFFAVAWPDIKFSGGDVGSGFIQTGPLNNS